MKSSTVLTGELDRVLRLRSHLRAVDNGDGRVLVLSEDNLHLLTGKVFSSLLPLLDGRHTIAELAAILDNTFPAQDVIHALTLLDQHGYLDDAPVSAGMPHRTFWNSVGLAADQVSENVRGSRVSTVEVGEVHDSRHRLATSLAGMGIDTATGHTSDRTALTVVLTDDYLREELSAIDEASREAGRPWLLVKPVGRVIWLGPLFTPGDGACWTCLAQRLRGNRRDELVACAAAGEPIGVPQPASDASMTIAVALASIQIAGILARTGEHTLDGTLKTVDTASLSSRDHPVARLPHCPACGNPPSVDKDGDLAHRLASLPRLELVSRRKKQGCRTSERVHAADDTVKRLAYLVSPITGIIPELAEKAAGETGHVFTCRQVTPWRPDSPVAHRDPTLGASGRGETEAAAKAACMAEAVERYCTTFQAGDVLITERFVDVADDAVHPNRLLQFSERQYAKRPSDAPVNLDRVPEPFDEYAAVDWVPAWSLTKARHRLLPARYCYYDAPRQGRDDCLADSNGCASGNVLEKAVLQGLYELIERDALAIWWYNRLRRPTVDPSTMTDDITARVDAWRAQLSEKGRTLEILDLTNDIAVPVVAAVSWGLDDGRRLAVGCASHLDRSTAVIKAIGELVQHDAEPTIETGVRARRRAVEPYLMVHNDAPGPAEPPPALSDDLRDDIETLVDRLSASDIEVLVVDVTRPDIDFPTVRVVAPGLRHHRNRLAPGRLYDVPVKLGWLASAHEEAALNPAPCPL